MLRSKLLLATRNPGKIREYKLLLQDLPFDLVTLEDIEMKVRIKEEGGTLEENAEVKARSYASLTGLLTLAEDSGLEVEALGGEPGVFSSSYGGLTTDKERISLLLKKMEGIPWEERKARFRCVIALASPQGEVKLFSGECFGFISFKPLGKGGFGYDPVFFFPELGKTFAQLSIEEKNKVSHRGKAARALCQFLRGVRG